MPLSFIEFSFIFLPLIILQIIEILKSLWLYTAILFEFRIVENASTLICVIGPFPLINQVCLLDISLAISLPFIIFKFSLVYFSIWESQGPKPLKVISLFLANIFRSILIDFLNPIECSFI